MDPVQTLSLFKKFLAVIAGVVFLMLVWTCLSSPMLVTVTGTGEASVAAQEATVSFSLSASDSSVAGAISQIKGKVQTVRNFLINSGISEEDIFESQLQVVPASAVVQGATGFQAVVSMAAKTVHVSSISELISNLYANGAVVVSQPVLSSGEKGKLEEEALDKAMKDAKTQAGKIALKNWKFIKKIVAVTQASSGSTSTVTSRADVVTESQNQTAAQNGVFKIVKAVSVSYKMW